MPATFPHKRPGGNLAAMFEDTDEIAETISGNMIGHLTQHHQTDTLGQVETPITVTPITITTIMAAVPAAPLWSPPAGEGQPRTEGEPESQGEPGGDSTA